MHDSIITQQNIIDFADTKVNLPQEKVDEYRAQVRSLRKKLESYIIENPDFELVKMINSGSVAKGTALKTINDMDVAVYVKQPKDINEGQLLNWLMERLKEAYSNLSPDQFSCPTGSHCVTISFRGTGLDVDVVPVILDENPDDYGYLITKDTGEKVRTNISLHKKFIIKRKEAQPHHFRQVVRLMKWWVRQQKNLDQDFRFKSFMVEMICAHLADNGLDMSDYSNALQKVFTYIIRTQLKERIFFTDYYEADELPEDNTGLMEIFDPVNPENNVSAKYTEENRTKILTAAQDALEALAEAQYATTKARSVELWQIILGPTFNP